MTNPTPPWIERLRKLWKTTFDNEPGADAYTNFELFLTQELARERKEGKQEGAEEKMGEVLEIVEEREKHAKLNGDIWEEDSDIQKTWRGIEKFLSDLKDRLIKP